MNNQQLWQAILGNLEVSLSKANFNTWFKNTAILERGSDCIILNVPSAFNRDWIAAKYHQDMIKALKTIAPEIREIKYFRCCFSCSWSYFFYPFDGFFSWYCSNCHRNH